MVWNTFFFKARVMELIGLGLKMGFYPYHPRWMAVLYRVLCSTFSATQLLIVESSPCSGFLNRYDSLIFTKQVYTFLKLLEFSMKPRASPSLIRKRYFSSYWLSILFQVRPPKAARDAQRTRVDAHNNGAYTHSNVGRGSSDCCGVEKKAL